MTPFWPYANGWIGYHGHAIIEQSGTRLAPMKTCESKRFCKEMVSYEEARHQWGQVFLFAIIQKQNTKQKENI